MHLLAQYPPKVPIPVLVNSRKGVSAPKTRQRHQIRTHREHPWPLLPTASRGGASQPIIKQYLEQQRTPRG